MLASREQHNYLNWRGISGTTYKMQICVMEHEWAQAPGLYLFAVQDHAGLLTAVYVGQTDDLRRRMSEYRGDLSGKWYAAKRLGIVSVHAMTMSGTEYDRKRIELDLIQGIKPRLNEVGLGPQSAARLLLS